MFYRSGRRRPDTLSGLAGTGANAVAVAPTYDPTVPWWQNILQDVGAVVNRPTASVDNLTAEVATTRQTVLYVAIGLAAVYLLGGRRR